MGRKRRSLEWLPERVYRGRSAYEWRPYGGGYVKLGPLTMTPLEVQAAYQRIAEGKQPDHTFQGLADLYFASPQFTRLAKNTRTDYENCSKMPLKVLGHLPRQQIRSATIREYVDRRTLKSASRANHELSWLRVVCAWGKERGYLETNPAKAVRKNPEPHRQRYVEMCELRAVLRQAPAQVRVGAVIAYLCGARLADMLALTWKDVDNKRGVYIRQHKTGKRQWKLWTPALRKVIARARRLPGKWGQHVVHTLAGTAYSRGGFQSLWKRSRAAALAAGTLKQSFTFHDLKAKGISDYDGDKQKFSGHRTASQVQVYDRKPSEVVALDIRKVPNIPNK